MPTDVVTAVEDVVTVLDPVILPLLPRIGIPAALLLLTLVLKNT